MSNVVVFPNTALFKGDTGATGSIGPIGPKGDKGNTGDVANPMNSDLDGGGYKITNLGNLSNLMIMGDVIGYTTYPGLMNRYVYDTYPANRLNDYALLQGIDGSTYINCSYFGSEGIVFRIGNASFMTILGNTLYMFSNNITTTGRITSGDVFISDVTKGLVMMDTQTPPHYWRYQVGALGVLTGTDLGTSYP